MEEKTSRKSPVKIKRADKNNNRDSSSLKNLDKEYIKNYRKWRRENRYGFYLEDDGSQLTYQDGVGFIKEIPAAKERAVLTKSTGMIIAMLILYTVIIFAGSAAVPGFVSSADIMFTHGYFRDIISGNEWIVFILSFIINMISRIIPFVIIIKAVKMPLNVMLPLKATNKPALYLAALPSALLNVCICFVLNQFYLSVLEKAGVDTYISFEIPSDPAVRVLTLTKEIFLLIVINEIMIRGAAMQLLRQFGDSYAIVITSIISAMECFDMRMSLCIFVNSIVIGYFTLRTGSVMTAILMRIIVRVSTIMLISLSNWSAGENSHIYIALFVFFGTVVPLTMICLYRKKYNDKMSIDVKHTFLSEYEKFMLFFTSPLTLIWLSLCFMVSLCTIPSIL